MSHELAIDWTRCSGHGLCAALAPHRISRDEWGFPLVHDNRVRPEELLDARRIVAVCPALALRITTAEART